jgi:hypothetical protein
MPLVTWLLSMVAPLVIRAVVALGFTAVTYTGVTALANSLMSIAQANWAALPAGVLTIAHLSGIDSAIGMIAGAYAARLAVWASINGVKYVLKS